MTKINRSIFRFLGVRAVAMMALVIGHSSLGIAATPGVAVVAVQPTRVADLVMLNGGFDAGLRQGMVCRVTRSGAAIAEVLLVELRSTCGAALILNLEPGQSIHAGDVASIKVLKS